MRTLKFIVSGQSIKKDPACDFSGLYPGTEGYLRAEFAFDEAWEGCAKIGVFQGSGVDCRERLDRNACMIPAAAAACRRLFVSVIGIRPGYRIATTAKEVKLNG